MKIFKKENDNKEDLKELKKQYEKYAKKKKGYIEVHVLIGKGESGAIPNIKVCNVGPMEVAKMINVLEVTAKKLEERFPFAGLAKMFYATEISEEQEDEIK